MTTISMATLAALLCMIVDMDAMPSSSEQTEVPPGLEKWSKHIEFLHGTGQISEDMLVDPAEGKITMTSSDSAVPGSMHVILDYKRGVAGFLLPSSRTCFVMENLERALPLPGTEDVSSEEGQIDHYKGASSTSLQQLYEPEEQLPVALVSELPVELQPLCRHWPTYRLHRLPESEAEENALSSLHHREERGSRHRAARFKGCLPHQKLCLQYCIKVFSIEVCLRTGH